MIDLVLMSDPAKLLTCAVGQPVGASDHSSIYLSFKAVVGETTGRLSKFGITLKQILLHAANQLLLDISWEDGFTNDIDTCWDFWKNTFFGGDALCIPSGCIKRHRLSWINKTLEVEMKKRDAVYKKQEGVVRVLFGMLTSHKEIGLSA